MIKIKNLGNKAEIYIHGMIVDDTDANFIDVEHGFVFPAMIREKLDELRGLPIDVHIASDGGDVAAGVAIYNFLAAHDAPVDVYIDAWAASIASYIAFVGRKIYMPANTFVMIHNPAGGGYGTAEYLRSVADWLDKLKNMLAETYTKRMKEADLEKIKSLMDAETWFTAEQVAEMFENVEVLASNENYKAVACFSEYKTAPKALKSESLKEHIINVIKGSY